MTTRERLATTTVLSRATILVVAILVLLVASAASAQRRHRRAPPTPTPPPPPAEPAPPPAPPAPSETPAVESEPPPDLDAICPASTRFRPARADDAQSGRAEFVAGLQEVEDERWADAVDQFRRSYSLSGSPVALYNMGLALRALSRHVEARNAFCTIALDPTLDDAIASEAGRMAATEARRIALLVVTDHDVPEGLFVSIDGERREIDAHPSTPITLELDADRAHDLLVSAPGYESRALTLTLTDGERRETELALARAGDDLWTSPWLWTGVGVVVVAGIVIGSVVGYDDAQLTPDHPAVVRFP